MTDRERLYELLASTQRDLMPSLRLIHEDDDLSLVHVVMLQVLDRGGEPTVNEMSRHIDRSVSRTSRIVDQLVRRGIAERREDDTDRRVRRIRITRQGSELLRRIRDLRIQTYLELLAHLTPEEKEAAFHALELFTKAARRIRDERDPTG